MVDKYRPVIPDGAHLVDSKDREGKRGLAYDKNGKLVDNVKWVKVDDDVPEYVLTEEDDSNDEDPLATYNEIEKTTENIATIIKYIVEFIHIYIEHKNEINSFFSKGYTGIKDFFKNLWEPRSKKIVVDKESTETNNVELLKKPNDKIDKEILKEPEVIDAAKELSESDTNADAEEHFIKAVLLSETLKKELEKYYMASAKENGTGTLNYDEYRSQVQKLTKDNIDKILRIDTNNDLSSQDITDLLKQMRTSKPETNPEEMQELLKDKNDNVSLKQKKHI